MQESYIENGFPNLEVGSRTAVLRHRDIVLCRFRVAHRDALDIAAALALVPHAGRAGDPLLVKFRTASPQARRLLRGKGISYASDDGEWFLLAPPVFVERPAQRGANAEPTRIISPFALRASRIPRWLLLNEAGTDSLVELARRVGLSEATVSRVARELADQGLVTLQEREHDGRLRGIRARDAGGLLDALERAAFSRRVMRRTWDIGASDVEEALAHWSRAAGRMPEAPYAVGGLAGAATVAHAVEPSSALVWVDPSQLARWGELLLPETARPGPGTVTVQVASDSFVLGLAEERNGLRIADPVQLYLDCRLAGERALEAAAAIRRVEGW
jgi:DNA-binding MarR family transcriptional regulator